jgi:hypothetical protein
MRDLFFKTTRARHPSKKLRFVYNFLRLQRSVNFVRQPRSSKSSFARFQILRKMFMWFYSDQFLRKHVLKKTLKSHVTGYGKFLSFCTKLEMLVPVILYRLHYIKHLKEGFLAVQQGLVLKNGNTVSSILHVLQPGEFIEFPYHSVLLATARSVLLYSLTFLKTISVDWEYWLVLLNAFLPSGRRLTDSLFLSYSASTPLIKELFETKVIWNKQIGDFGYRRLTCPMQFVCYYLHYKTTLRQRFRRTRNRNRKRNKIDGKYSGRLLFPIPATTSFGKLVVNPYPSNTFDLFTESRRLDPKTGLDFNLMHNSFLTNFNWIHDFWLEPRKPNLLVPSKRVFNRVY